jgi:protein-tyrosine phosphatase
MLRTIMATVICFSCLSFGKNLHLIDQDSTNGFQIYRYGQPSKKEMEEMKALGITEVMVLSGDADAKGNEKDFGFKIFYNEKQSEKEPVSKVFLDKFDKWVEEAKDTGKKIAFRCECGCHRTGRLAAYYQMKYQNLTYEDATAIMDEHGSLMFLHRQLWPQVKSMEEYIQGKSCTQKIKYCLN